MISTNHTLRIGRLLLASALVLLALFHSLVALSPANADPSDGIEYRSLIERLTLETGAVIAGAGEDDAKLTIVEFSDPICPICRAVKPFVDALRDDRTDVRVIYREFPLFGSKSHVAASALVSAEKFDAGSAMEKGLVQISREPSFEEAISIAVDIGIDEAKFRELIFSPDTLDEVNQRFPEHSYSSDAARALYSARPELRTRLRDAFYDQGPPLDRDAVMQVLARLNGDEIEAEMYSEATQDALSFNYEFAHELEFTGTPNFVLIGDDRIELMRGWDPELIDSFLMDVD